MTASCQITCTIPGLSCEQLPYLLEYLGFLGCGKEISQICPCPSCPINSSFLGTPFPLHHPAIQLYFSSGGALLNPQDLRQASFFVNSGVFQRPPSRQDGRRFRRPRGQTFISSIVPFSCIPVHLRFTLPNIFLPLFLCIFIPQNTRNYPTKLSSLPINHIFSVSAL
jgi:hypothetical protein